MGGAARGSACLPKSWARFVARRRVEGGLPAGCGVGAGEGRGRRAVGGGAGMLGEEGAGGAQTLGARVAVGCGSGVPCLPAFVPPRPCKARPDA